ncbi:IclR family transcriptional regulator [Cellulomonas denverensis]|uniref:IclR family transcriptional regulator n=1 Tax=Cellulomonas denverensis TaxID=264297 RepID=A0A7X6QXQ6_9CELL|nr:IclR family transcriptional regulator [Cellulomonas denverensis]NKY21397.1 IclR family transcriptional regulator [Cellulomonas denverensis]GIG27036.1 IclR family transcriptional regulator [Cellulomonas denverensis]
MAPSPPAPELSGRNESLSVRRCLHLLDHVRAHADAGRGVPVLELADAIGVHRSTAARLLAPLIDEGLLVRDAAGRYRLGPGALRLGQAYLGSLDLPALAEPELRRLAERTGGICVLGVPEQDRIRVQLTTGRGRGSLATGSLVPSYCTAWGKAVLSVAPAAWIDRAIATGLQPLTPRTITDPTELRGELDRTRQRGFALDDREHDPHLRAVAAPVLSHTGMVVAAVGVALDHHRMPPVVLRENARATAELARSLSAAMGWSRPPRPTSREA